MKQYKKETYFLRTLDTLTKTWQKQIKGYINKLNKYLILQVTDKI